MDYLELNIEGINGEQKDILISRLLERGFESFGEDEERLKAYIQLELADMAKIRKIIDEFHVSFTSTRIPKENWNEEWEKHYDPVLISGNCYIRAPFHPPLKGIRFDIIIEPKMSFGTAHHETPSLMIEMMMESDFTSKKVLDMGCGTGILAIFAKKLGAAEVDAVDNDEWAVENAIENVRKNHAASVRVSLGDVKKIRNQIYDCILANINRNVLLEDIPFYEYLIDRGELLLSGFYKEDIPLIIEKAENHRFRFITMKSKNNWVALKFTR
jgi:ribosomal protein L11 methyltransferase